MGTEKKQLSELKVALVHDFLLYPGGAEKVLSKMAEMFPQAPIYTLLYDEERMKNFLPGRKIRTSFLQKFPRFLRRHRWLSLLYAPAVENLDFRDFDLVISSSGAWSKGIITRLSTTHLAYLHSPMRFAWDYRENYLREELPRWLHLPWRLWANYLRIWDRLAAERPDFLIANSRYTQERIAKYYRRESRIIYPPISLREQAHLRNVAGGSASKNRDYFLIVSRLSPYKKVNLAVEAFNKLELPLVIVGEGRQKEALKKMAQKNIQILGWQNPDDLEKIYSQARALVFPGVDDFGMTMAEALGRGVPVIAFRKGGAEEIVQEGKTGEFFEAQNVEVLSDAVRRFVGKENGYSAESCRSAASPFSQGRFREELLRVIKEELNVE